MTNRTKIHKLSLIILPDQEISQDLVKELCQLKIYVMNRMKFDSALYLNYNLPVKKLVFYFNFILTLFCSKDQIKFILILKIIFYKRKSKN